MTREELAEIKARAEAATPGPWHHNKSGSVVYNTTDGQWQTIHGSNQYYDPGWTVDAYFIAHAIEDVPTLVAEVERLTAKLEHTTGQLLHLAHVLAHADDDDE